MATDNKGSLGVSDKPKYALVMVKLVAMLIKTYSDDLLQQFIMPCCNKKNKNEML